MKRILISTKQKDELIIAFINKKELYNIYIENINYSQNKFNIYKSKIIKIEPSLNAVFINYGYKKNGFLPIKEISNNFFLNNGYKNDNQNYYEKIKNLKKDQEILVQINKESRRNKCASFTTFISLIGTYIILIVNNPNIKGISKKIIGKNRFILKKMISNLNISKNIGFIIRTSCIGKKIEDIQLDLNLILKNWEFIKEKYIKSKCPSLIYENNNIFIKIFRDYLTPDIKEIIIDDINFFNKSKEYINILGRFEFNNKIKIYDKNISIFNYFKIESQIESIFKRKIKLSSGGSISIDSTEALTAIDINSYKSTKFTNIKETAFKTNLEAIKEIAKQLRFRDISGLIVIDFIDMFSKENNLEIENEFRKYLYLDKSKICMENISKFGLLELSRQRLNKSLNECNNICTKCNGIGFIRNYESLSLSILRFLEKKSLNKNIEEICIIVPLFIRIYLLKNKKKEIYNIKNINNKNIKLIILSNNNIRISNNFIIKIKYKNKNYINYICSKINKFNILNFNNIKNKLKNLFKLKLLGVYNINYINKKILYKNILLILIYYINKLIITY
ncbi:Rne/Rng family ribonuclease [endosymbiont of Pachyrhynchus infernalis]|uniref:Rne/Rng family ribonuclease n=1 Tax=endosymbiont of Pachyrhynchus infernalis TaxID=1971488 RepID=UPI000DC6E58B|nr:Rne/Rng family ribonuclease [endosymbiont of Pachyrhynchus infernalis]BBA84887.1 ribonuclease E [endosymbiont of Pachyrhynchus infernalis]